MNKHGGYFGDSEKKIIDFSVNINPLGVPDTLKEKLKKSIDNLESYPEIDGISAKNTLSKKLNVDREDIILGNGATELIYLFAKTFKPKRVLIVEPTFTEYERAFYLNESEVYHFKCNENDEFKINIELLLKDIDEIRPETVVICNPNNPTGIFTEWESMKFVLDKLKTMSGSLFIDESFIDFTEKHSYIAMIEDYPIFILRSMTKIYAIPGLRLGYGLANKTIIEKLNKYKEPWTINSLALDSVEVLIDDNRYIEETKKWYTSEKKYLKENLKQIKSLTVYESEGNFFLCKLKKSNSIELRDYLLKLGIYIRTCEDFYGLDDRFIRIAVRSREENIVLIEKLNSYFTI